MCCVKVVSDVRYGGEIVPILAVSTNQQDNLLTCCFSLHFLYIRFGGPEVKSDESTTIKNNK